MAPLVYYLALAAILFAVGLFGILTRKNIIGILMSLEILFNAVNINFVAFNRYVWPDALIGQLFSIFIIVVAAAEAVVGLAIVLLIYRNWQGVDIENVNIMKW